MLSCSRNARPQKDGEGSGQVPSLLVERAIEVIPTTRYYSGRCPDGKAGPSYRLTE